jgi:hypothetical protein
LQLRCNYGRQEQFSIIPNITPAGSIQRGKPHDQLCRDITS